MDPCHHPHALHQMKRDGRKIAGVVCWDAAGGADRRARGRRHARRRATAVGVNLWGHDNPLEVTLDEILICCKAVRRGAKRALVSCDMPFGPLQMGVPAAVAAAVRIVKEGGADMIKLDGSAYFPEGVTALTRAGIPVFAQFGLSPQTAMHFGVPYAAQSGAGVETSPAMMQKLVDQAKMLEQAGAALLDFTNSGPVAGEAVTKAVKIPVIGGFGGGPWLDGRVRLAQTATGSSAKWLDAKTDTYFNSAKASLQAFETMIEDVRAARQIKG